MKAEKNPKLESTGKAETALIDEARFENLLGDLHVDLRMLGKVITAFGCGATESLADMASAIETGDAKALFVHAHALKGSAYIVGAAQIAALAEDIERHAQSGELQDLQALISETADCVERTIIQLAVRTKSGA